MYYVISNIIIELEQAPDNELYTYIELNTEQIAYYLANKDVVIDTRNRRIYVSEVLAMELEPIPEPQEPTEPEPTLEERISALELLELERIFQ